MMNRRGVWRGAGRGQGGYGGPHQGGIGVNSPHHGPGPQSYNQPAYTTPLYNQGKPPMHQQQQGPPQPKPVPPPMVQMPPSPVQAPPVQMAPKPPAPVPAPPKPTPVPAPMAPVPVPHPAHQTLPPHQKIPPPATALPKPGPQEQPPISGDVIPMDESEDVPHGGGPNNGKKKSHSWFWFRKSPGMYMRVSKKIRKRRQNARLRHLLAPKNAMMVLHELYPELKMVVSEQVNAANQMVYTVDIEIDGKVYRGHGMSKIAAKQAGSENALKAVLLDKLTQNNVKINPDEETVDVKMEVEKDEAKPTEAASETDGANKGPAVEVKTEGGVEEGQQPPFRRFPEDDVPWGSLASYALYKLFTEWQAQGFQLPASSYMAPVFQKTHLNPVQTPAGASGSAAPMKKIPEDANQKHPVQLLNQIRPGCQYTETRVGDPPNLTFTFTVNVDGKSYKGVGHNKKDAKKECAKRALEAMGVKYD